jgi:hypothetical protein
MGVRSSAGDANLLGLLARLRLTPRFPNSVVIARAVGRKCLADVYIVNVPQIASPLLSYIQQEVCSKIPVTDRERCFADAKDSKRL